MSKIRVAVLIGVLSCGFMASTALAGTAEAEQETAPMVRADPWEPFNQQMFWFNLQLDEYMLRPVATAYDRVMPDAGKRGVQRFFNNLGVVERFANNLFQGKLSAAGQEVGRFLVNTTVGCAGFLDVAEPVFGWKESPEDFGQTLAVYGVVNGPYLVLPLYGPSTVRDTAGLVADGALNPLNYLLSSVQVIAIRSGVVVTNAVNSRSMNLQFFEDVDRYAVDLYGAVQDGYLQRREQAIEE